MRRFEDQDEHELLGLGLGATADEIRTAYERLTYLLAPDSLAVYSIAEREELASLHARLRQAYTTLTGRSPEEKRALAERLLGRLGRGRAETSADSSTNTDSHEPSTPVPGNVGYGGPELRRLREELQLTLQQVSAHTRISIRHLTAIEDEEFAALPQRAYLRGFIIAYARMLGLEGETVWSSYRQRWEQAGFGSPAPGPDHGEP